MRLRVLKSRGEYWIGDAHDGSLSCKLPKRLVILYHWMHSIQDAIGWLSVDIAHLEKRLKNLEEDNHGNKG